MRVSRPVISYRDAQWIRYLVGFSPHIVDVCTNRFQILYLCIAETANSAFDMALVYEPLITRYGKMFLCTSVFRYIVIDGSSSGSPLATVIVPKC